MGRFQRVFRQEYDRLLAERELAQKQAAVIVNSDPPKPLRPTTWGEYIGQQSLRERLRIHADAALSANRRMDHVLLIAPPGAGKTALAEVIAHSMSANFKSYVWPVDSAVLEKVVKSFAGVLFLDEIHRGTAARQERLLPLIEDDYLQRSDGSRIYADGRITVVAATTEPDRIIAPLYDRFAIKPPFDEYTDDEMALIVIRMAGILKASIDHKTAVVLGRATGGLPRNAESLVVLMRDMQDRSQPTASDVLKMARVTAEGFTADHLAYLTTLRSMGGTAGLRTIATHLRLPEAHVRDLERLLVKKGKIRYGEKGRTLR